MLEQLKALEKEINELINEYNMLVKLAHIHELKKIKHIKFKNPPDCITMLKESIYTENGNLIPN